MLTIRRFQTGDENALSALIRRTLREVNYTSPKSELDYLIPHYSPETMAELSRTGHTYVLEEDGQIVGSGTVANEDTSLGASCFAEQRTVETLRDGKPTTPFMGFGDTVRIEVLDRDGHSIFGAIEQRIERQPAP